MVKDGNPESITNLLLVSTGSTRWINEDEVGSAAKTFESDHVQLDDRLQSMDLSSLANATALDSEHKLTATTTSPLAFKRARSFLTLARVGGPTFSRTCSSYACTLRRDTNTPLFGALMGICSSCLGLNRHPSQQEVGQSQISRCDSFRILTERQTNETDPLLSHADTVRYEADQQREAALPDEEELRREREVLSRITVHATE